MPLSRVPVEHKFGILSQGQAKSILRQTVAEESKRRRQQGKEKWAIQNLREVCTRAKYTLHLSTLDVAAKHVYFCTE